MSEEQQKVIIRHVRQYQNQEQFKKSVRKRLRSVTIVGKYDKESKNMSVGYAKCSSEDNFCKVSGVRLATQRAEENPLFTISGLAEDMANAVLVGLSEPIALRMCAPKTKRMRKSSAKPKKVETPSQKVGLSTEKVEAAPEITNAAVEENVA